MTLISVVFSFHNEEEVLPLLINSVRNILDTVPENYELIFVNDASTDNSAQVIRNEAQSQFVNSKGQIRLITLSRRFGVEESFLAGIQATRGDAVVLMYSDMQDPAQVILDMLTHWRKGSETVHTVRRRRVGESRTKLAAAHIAYRLISRIADIPIPVDSGEFKLMSRKVTQELLSLKETDPYLRGLVPWIGYVQSTVEYDMQPRMVGKSKVRPFGKKAWSVFFSGVTSFSFVPLYVTLLIGFFGTLLSATALVISCVLFLFEYSPVVPTWIAFGILLWATIIFSVGWVGIYVSRIYKDVRNRPRYIISKVEEF